MKFRALLFFLLTGRVLVAQYSPYYYHTNHIDKGIQSEEHRDFLKKVHFRAYNNHDAKYETGLHGNLVKTTPETGLEMRAYLDHSLKFYYDKYRETQGMNPADWDYDAASFLNKYNETMVKGHLVFAMIINGDTAAFWKRSLYNGQFGTETEIQYTLWRKSLKQMTFENSAFPLFQHLRKQKKAGDFNVRVVVYAGKVKCESPADRGPEVLAEGSFVFSVSSEKLKEISEIPDHSMKSGFSDLDEMFSPTWKYEEEKGVKKKSSSNRVTPDPSLFNNPQNENER